MHNYPKSVVLDSFVKPSLDKPACPACLPRLGLTEDSRTTHFRYCFWYSFSWGWRVHDNYGISKRSVDL